MDGRPGQRERVAVIPEQPVRSTITTQWDGLREALADDRYVSLGSRRTASVHEFYRYPARFTPSFARAAIDAFTAPGELVLDPYAGGGTTLVEAQLAGRRSIGSDINPLATFVTRAKTCRYTSQDLDLVQFWADSLRTGLRLTSSSPTEERWASQGYFRNVSDTSTWRLRATIAASLRSLQRLEDAPSAAMLARCAILRTGQWALDMRTELPTVAEFRDKLSASAAAMTVAAREHCATLAADAPSPSVIDVGLPGLAARLREANVRAPSLIVTSPPYPGVYVLYHRWKVRGRLETPLPYWIANSTDGQGLAHYTMGARADRTGDAYFDRLSAAANELGEIADDRTVLCQLVGFSDPDTQLPRFLAVFAAAGFDEVAISDPAAEGGRLWRSVPSRRWWVAARQGVSAPHTSREVLLLHRKAAK